MPQRAGGRGQRSGAKQSPSAKGTHPCPPGPRGPRDAARLLPASSCLPLLLLVTLPSLASAATRTLPAPWCPYSRRSHSPPHPGRTPNSGFCAPPGARTLHVETQELPPGKPKLPGLTLKTRCPEPSARSSAFPGGRGHSPAAFLGHRCRVRGSGDEGRVVVWGDPKTFVLASVPQTANRPA